MERYSSFVLQFCYGLIKSFLRLETFLFAERIMWVSPQLEGKLSQQSLEELFELAKEECGRGTNIAQSLHGMQVNFDRMLTKNKIIIIVSDAKTVAGEESVEELRKIARKTKGVFWLNPIAKNLWNQYSAIYLLGKYCRMVECSTLSQLDEIMHKVLL
ncbi:VWA domain-containing protein [Bacillota bacterium LX-D]|nr:VWA domain-containing protein [Bacillota bacterium LX-D]